MTGIVMEEHKQHIIVMTPDSRFIKIKKTRKKYSIGEEISFSLETESTPFFSNKWFELPSFKLSFVSLLVFVLVFVPFLYQNEQQKTYAYVSIDINPSVNIAINEKMNVIDIDALNDDGKIIVRSLKDWKNEKIAIVTDKILKQSVSKGYLKDEKEVLISIAFAKDNKKTKSINQDTFKSFEKDMLGIAEKRELALTTFQTTKEIHEEAKNKNISPNKYVIVQTAKEKGMKLKTEEIKNKSVNDISDEVGNLNSFINNKKEKVIKNNSKKSTKEKNVQSSVKEEETNTNKNRNTNTSTVVPKQEEAKTNKTESPKTDSTKQNNKPSNEKVIKNNTLNNASQNKNIVVPTPPKHIPTKPIKPVEPLKPVEPKIKNNKIEIKEKANDLKIKIEKK